jgi:D-glycero-D-manno-heptose 1,7-bisphosphate phosphatase
MKAAVFLDRDGVLVQDVDLLVRRADLRLLAGVPAALNQLRQAGYALIVASNQTVVARGLATEAEVSILNEVLQEIILKAGGPLLDGWYFCPHHPNANVPVYRMNCDCRKPQPGLLRRAAGELGLDLSTSFMVGDRITDIIAGARAGCRTVLVETGMHSQPPIETVEPIDLSTQPDHRCASLRDAADWILNQGRPRTELRPR